MLVEQRKYERFQVQEGGIAAFTPHWPHSTVMGDILDISTNGLAFRYVAALPPQDGAFDLTIVYLQTNLHLTKISIKTIWERIDGATGFGLGKRRLGVQFGEIHDEQRADLEFFIRTCTAPDDE
jgi:hypothetical protein